MNYTGYNNEFSTEVLLVSQVIQNIKIKTKYMVQIIICTTK